MTWNKTNIKKTRFTLNIETGFFLKKQTSCININKLFFKLKFRKKKDQHTTNKQPQTKQSRVRSLTHPIKRQRSEIFTHCGIRTMCSDVDVPKVSELSCLSSFPVLDYGKQFNISRKCVLTSTEPGNVISVINK